MRPYAAILSARFRALLQYRAAALAGLGTQIFWGFIRVMIFLAFFHGSAQPQPIDLPQTITYLWLTQALLMLLPWRGDAEVEAMVRSGNLAYELARPVDLYNLWFMRSLAMRTAPTLLRGPPLLVLALLFFGMGLPASPAAAAWFVVGLAGAVLLGAAITTLLSISMLWTISVRGTQALTGAAVNFFSGAIVPLPLMPDWAQAALAWQPLRGLMDTPFRLYLGSLSGADAALAVGHQLLWTLLLAALGRWILCRGLSRVVVQGG